MESKTFDEVPEKSLFYIIVYGKRAGYIPKFVGSITGFFFACRKMSKCRSPPLFNLNLKKQIERRNEKWHNAQKEESIGIILIH